MWTLGKKIKIRKSKICSVFFFFLWVCCLLWQMIMDSNASCVCECVLSIMSIADVTLLFQRGESQHNWSIMLRKRVKQLAEPEQFSFKIISVHSHPYLLKTWPVKLWSEKHPLRLSLFYCLSYLSLMTSLIGLTIKTLQYCQTNIQVHT